MKRLGIGASVLAIVGVALILAWFFKPIKASSLLPTENFKVMEVTEEGVYEEIDITGRDVIYTLLTSYSCRRSSLAKPAAEPSGAFNLMFDEGYAVFTENEGYIAFFDNDLYYSIINYDGYIYTEIKEAKR